MFDTIYRKFRYDIRYDMSRVRYFDASKVSIRCSIRYEGQLDISLPSIFPICRDFRYDIERHYARHSTCEKSMSPVTAPTCNRDAGSFQAESRLLPVASGASLCTTTDTCCRPVKETRGPWVNKMRPRAIQEPELESSPKTFNASDRKITIYLYLSV